MPYLLIVAQSLSIVAFLGYGIACFCSPTLTAEFRRWGLAPIQRITGALEILGALGLLAGFLSPTIRLFSSAALTCMMLCAVGVRIKISDPFVQWTPALILLFINLYIALHSASALSLFD